MYFPNIVANQILSQRISVCHFHQDRLDNVDVYQTYSEHFNSDTSVTMALHFKFSYQQSCLLKLLRLNYCNMFLIYQLKSF